MVTGGRPSVSVFAVSTPISIAMDSTSILVAVVILCVSGKRIIVVVSTHLDGRLRDCV